LALPTPRCCRRQTLYHGKALLIAQADEVAPRGPEFALAAASCAAQQAHLDRLRAVDPSPKRTRVLMTALRADIQLSRGKKRSNTN